MDKDRILWPLLDWIFSRQPCPQCVRLCVCSVCVYVCVFLTFSSISISLRWPLIHCAFLTTLATSGIVLTHSFTFFSFASFYFGLCLDHAVCFFSVFTKVLIFLKELLFIQFLEVCKNVRLCPILCCISNNTKILPRLFQRMYPTI